MSFPRLKFKIFISSGFSVLQQKDPAKDQNWSMQGHTIQVVKDVYFALFRDICFAPQHSIILPRDIVFLIQRFYYNCRPGELQ